MSPEQVTRRRAIEALRSGVPSWEAVSLLGSGQPEAEDRFVTLLDSPSARAAAGLLLGGGFGAGKSHVLSHLAHLALDEGYVVSTVVISKETPLHDPAKVFRAALDTAVAPGRIPGVLADAVAAIDLDSPRYAALSRWVTSAASGLDERFAATLLLFERLRGGEVPGADETLDAVLRFWAGDPLRVTDLRRALKAVGAAGLFTLPPVAARDLARQRLAFLARLLHAAGHAGWVILFDEVELIGRYSLLQRARSYAELARWLRADPGPATGGRLVPVFAITDDFESAVIEEKQDHEQVPARLRAKQIPEWDETAALAEEGMRALGHDLVLLTPPDRAELDRAYAALKALHGHAFDWAPPDVPGLERLGATSMRQHVRAWINEWDLVRLDPDYRPETVAGTLASHYAEEPALEAEERGAE